MTFERQQANIIEINYVCGDDGKAYYAKGHVPLDYFMAAVKNEEIEGSTIIECEPSHLWLRVCRDFQEECAIFIEAKPGSRGAFKATWVQDE